jgi:hypothetical protein
MNMAFEARAEKSHGLPRSESIDEIHARLRRLGGNCHDSLCRGLLSILRRVASGQSL